MFERVGQLIAAASAACVAGSVLFDLGYFYHLDPRMFLMLSLPDHLNRALVAIPYVLALFIVTWSLDIASTAVLADLARRRGKKPARYPAAVSWFGFALGMAGVSYWLELPGASVVIGVASLLCAGWYAVTGPGMTFLLRQSLPELSKALRWVPICAIVACSAGWFTAIIELKQTVGEHRVVTISGEVFAVMRILASTEKGLFLRHGTSQAPFLLTWSQVREVGLDLSMPPPVSESNSM